MRVINLIKSEFIKNYSIKRFICIIIILLISSLFLVNSTNKLLDNKNTSKNTLQVSIDSFSSSIAEFENKKSHTIDEEYNYYLNKKYVSYAEEIKDNTYDRKDFKYILLTEELLPLVMKNYLIDNNEKYLSNNCNQDIFDEHYSNNVFENKNTYINELCKYPINELNDIYKFNVNEISELENLLKENKYYLYLEHEIEVNRIDNNKMVQLLISKKVESNYDYLALNYQQYNILEAISKSEIETKQEFEEMLKNYPHQSYSIFFNHNSKLKQDATIYRDILIYSTENEIKANIHYNTNDSITEDIQYQNTKLKVDYILHLSIIVCLLISIMNGGIISNEHNRGTIKKIITAPVRRWKILLSKFIYLVLDAYIIWFIGLIILSVVAGLKYGFTDLFTPQLIYKGGKVIEVNYYLYLLKDMLIASISIICFLSIMFFISAISLNTSLTVGISTFLSITSLSIWLINIVNTFKYIVYTPLWYLDYCFIKTNSGYYINSLDQINYNKNLGLLITLIIAIVFYIATNVVYSIRDIKNK